MRKLTDYATVVMTSVARAPDRTHSAANLALQTGLTLVIDAMEGPVGITEARS